MHHGKRLCRTFGRGVMRSEHGVRLTESGFAGLATPALYATFTEVAELIAVLVLASYARHGLFSTCVLRRKPYNQFGSGMRLTPRSGLAPTSVDAEAGARYVTSCRLRWDNGNIHRGAFASESDLNCDSHRFCLSLAAPMSRSHWSGSYLSPKSPLPRVGRIRSSEHSEPITLRSPNSFLSNVFVTLDNCVDVPKKILVATDADSVLHQFFSDLCRRQTFRVFPENNQDCFSCADLSGQERLGVIGFRQRLIAVANLYPRLKLFIYALLLTFQPEDFLPRLGEFVGGSHTLNPHGGYCCV